MPEEVRDKMKFHLVESMDEVLEIVFDGVVRERAGGRGRVPEARLRGAAGERRPLKRPTQEVERDLEGP